MSKIQGLRILVKQFLSAAADEIVEAVEKIIAGYEEEMFQTKREIRNRISEEAQLNLSVWEEDSLTEQQQEWNSSPRQKNPESLQTERRHKEPLSSSQDRRPEDDTVHGTFTPQCVKHEHEICKEEEEPVPVTSAEQMPIETDEEVPSPGFSEAENGDEDEDWKLSDATQDSDSDRSEEWRPSTLTVKTPRMKKKLKSSVICRVCGKDFHSEVSLVNHVESHPKDGCGLCGMLFKTEEDFKLHLKTHKNVKAKVCDVCGKCFGKTSHLTVHLRIHTGERPYKCTICTKCFRSNSNLRKHTRTHLKDKTLTANTTVSDKGNVNAGVKYTRAQKNVKAHVCTICGRCFARPGLLEAHTRGHTGERPFKCSECEKCFFYSSGLRKHKKRKHSL